MGDDPEVLAREIAAFESMQNELEQNYMGKWVLFHDSDFIGSFDTLERTAEEAVRKFGRGPYLIRQVGALPMVMPASVMYRAR